MTAGLSLRKLPSFAGRPGPLLLVIADGVGVAPPGPSNAVTEADTPVLDQLYAGELYTELAAHGPAVGLPSDDDMGNSEVGHNALGAGRIFAQGAKLVNAAIASGAMFDSRVWKTAIEQGRVRTLHLLGLHSDGNVHSHTAHLYAMLRRAAAEGVTSAAVHILHDGRDVAARSALNYIAATEAVLAEINAGAPGRNFRIASGGGRMKITMDRYGADWPMVARGYQCHTHGVGRPFASATEAVTTMYAESATGDQYLGEFVVVDADGQPVGTVADADAVLLFNFRGDRAIEISRAFEEVDFPVFDRTGPDGRLAPIVFFAGMLQYDGDALIPKQYLVEPPTIDRTISEYLCAEGVHSFAVSETQKFGHVTYFWNGNRSGYIDRSLETYVEIPSDNVEFDTTPAMKVREITDAVIDLLRSGEYRFGRLNFPSGDMVGHTGNLEATIEAVDVIDECMRRLVEVIRELDGVLVFTADHGNADVMYTEAGGVRSPKTSHTLSPVPFAIYDPNYDGDYRMTPPAGAGLSNVAATLLNLLGYEAPADYRQSIISF
ncbi:MAG: 2,3-bisphosphoglycerate-independent phosphoglycerate mutase [Ilumatobacteraceae bacterium]|jgi:2,3-bisphosphoglycerate-independent phosphoglycerate mutase|nr:2,3-bisphosphoglycerate-independent phosphoglycerate mutase [Acidimicrobiaceae bacterium]MBP6488676.1 2,3-bisphosphoglycerate-independent phosphoglycerate mutase [Ilumatobacteraceae bacterium]MBP7891220.1 2,3-bisphosphoglycerate-independent phosphoglycerate mutase [Ilumatobacteraceae bacterium]MBP8209972.1 2,3-bisphosphoglycerate-independent phosphoglycerate mutase [Ilumatobacteraceae bacterium]HQY85721.1 2,3-bisphosphoglycerate-independent phosphoglycerate mutase [Ilumatobacteraceae bacteri